MPAKQGSLVKRFGEDDERIEIGVDEAGRGPMLGRVYSAAVVLPKEGDYRHELMKDSKRFTSDRKIREVASYIKEHALAWGVGYATEQDIDRLNIRQATFQAMHSAIKQVVGQRSLTSADSRLLIDGNDFKAYTSMDPSAGIVQLPHVCIEGGDNKYTAIAAASILAKVARDDYIADICAEDPTLDDRYGIMKNKGYGTKAHMEGIAKHGITKHLRKTFGSCRLHSGT